MDPGPTTGIAVLDLGAARLGDGAQVFQCDADAACWLLGALLAARVNAGERGLGQIEPFIRGRGPGARMAAGRATADQVEQLAGVAAAWEFPLTAVRSAGMVKPWAEADHGRRLEVSGLASLVPGMPHARSALRNALWCACHDAGCPDPLSRKAAR